MLEYYSKPGAFQFLKPQLERQAREQKKVNKHKNNYTKEARGHIIILQPSPCKTLCAQSQRPYLTAQSHCYRWHVQTTSMMILERMSCVFEEYNMCS